MDKVYENPALTPPPQKRCHRKNMSKTPLGEARESLLEQAFRMLIKPSCPPRCPQVGSQDGAKRKHENILTLFLETEHFETHGGLFAPKSDKNRC